MQPKRRVWEKVTAPDAASYITRSYRAKGGVEGPAGAVRMRSIPSGRAWGLLMIAGASIVSKPQGRRKAVMLQEVMRHASPRASVHRKDGETGSR